MSRTRLLVYVLLIGLLFDGRWLAGVAFAGCYLLERSPPCSPPSSPAGRSCPDAVGRWCSNFPTPDAEHQVGDLVSWTEGSSSFGTPERSSWRSASSCAGTREVDESPEALALETRAAEIESADPGTPRSSARRRTASRSAQQADPSPGGSAPRCSRSSLSRADRTLTVGILTSFLAREVFVSTVAVLQGGGEDIAEDDGQVLTLVREARRDDEHRSSTRRPRRRSSSSCWRAACRPSR